MQAQSLPSCSLHSPPSIGVMQRGLLCNHRQWIGEAVPVDEPEKTLKLRAAGQLCSQALAAFPAVLARAQLLPLAEQVGCARPCLLAARAAAICTVVGAPVQLFAGNVACAAGPALFWC